MTYSVLSWLGANLVGILGILVGGFIAYHVYFLSKKIDFRSRLEHKARISSKVEELLAEIAKGRRRKVELVNARRYPHSYLGENEQDRHGYAYLGAELKALRFDGVEFFSDIRALYVTEDGRWALSEVAGAKRFESNAAVVGVIPYEWIEFLDPRGDEFSYRAQFFTNFKGRNNSPYKYVRYYRKNENYQPDTDPLDWQWVSLESVIAAAERGSDGLS
jgi:hypothetical protein